MKQESLIVPRPRKRRYAPYLGEISPAPENLLSRDFQASVPNEKSLTDITEFQIPAGKLYLSPIIYCFNGMVFCWTMSVKGSRGERVIDVTTGVTKPDPARYCESVAEFILPQLKSRPARWCVRPPA